MSIGTQKITLIKEVKSLNIFSLIWTNFIEILMIS